VSGKPGREELPNSWGQNVLMLVHHDQQLLDCRLKTNGQHTGYDKDSIN